MAKLTVQALMYPGDSKSIETRSLLNSKIANRYDSVDVTYIDYDSPDGQELVKKYNNSSFPYILINDELFCTGKLDSNTLIKKINEELERIKNLEKGESI